jgi:hypothetical protein
MRRSYTAIGAATRYAGSLKGVKKLQAVDWCGQALIKAGFLFALICVHRRPKFLKLPAEKGADRR